MLSSYQFSERYNAQSLLWDAVGLIVATVRNLAAIVGRVAAFVFHFLPLLLIALGLTAVCVVGAAIIAMVPVTFWLGLLIVGAFGWVTYPRAKVVK